MPASWEKLDISPWQKVRNRTDELTVDDVVEAREDPRPVAQLKQLTGVEVLWAHVPGAIDIPGPQRPHTPPGPGSAFMSSPQEKTRR